jgi:hypothetical protein
MLIPLGVLAVGASAPDRLQEAFIGHDYATFWKSRYSRPGEQDPRGDPPRPALIPWLPRS